MAAQFLKLLENKKRCDVVINVDKNDNKKKVYAHSIILEARSNYFENVLSNGMARKENEIFILDLPDITAKNFGNLIR